MGEADVSEADLNRMEALGRRMGQQPRAPIYTPRSLRPKWTLRIFALAVVVGLLLLWALNYVGASA